MTRTIILLSLLSFTLSCGGAGAGGARPVTTPEADKPVPSDTVITLERTRCYGTCPSYEVTIYADGRVVYEGRKFVKVEGTANGSVTQEQLRQLVAEFEKTDYFSLRDTYGDATDGCPTYMTDNPFANTSLRLGGRSKAIRHYYGCAEKGGGKVYPQSLYALEGRIDEVVGTARWVKGDAKDDTPRQ